MTQTSQNQHEKSLNAVLLPRWMRLVAVAGGILLISTLVIALSDGADRTPIEQSPYRNAPEEVLSPGG
ncbi:MAG: hypothetical protein AAGL23_07285 [Pseudomonadota bacterium]